ncbi:hypothetical protein [Aggregatibacter kilianii]|uniref:hypothetical protein n=1 Tax=Aggregatibacter kilianii TaxID=2025884 RepID=UPI000D64D534|nr:hypothetical protein [Aggregatibacter kilianii]RDE87618.1 hypothetical protein DPV90_00925 [Aggregatibacter aphrophilus]
MSKYFKYQKELRNLSSDSVVTKLGALGAMTLKAVANVGILIITEVAPEMAKNTLNKYDRNLNDEQREKLHKVVNNGETFEKKITKYTNKE